MIDQKIYRIAGVCSLASIATFFIEFPFYLVRSSFPTMTEASKLPDFAVRNAINIMSCVFLDFLILSLFLVFAAGLRHLFREADPQREWLGTLFFGIGLVYVTLTLIADSLQATMVVDALTPPADPTIVRAVLECTYLMYGAVALWLMAFFMAIAGYVTLATGALPKWSGWVAYACALACLAFVPSMFVHHVSIFDFYNPAGWGATAVASGFPLAAWMIVFGILMLRKSGQPNRTASEKATRIQTERPF